MKRKAKAPVTLKTLGGSAQAKRLAAGILEALAGLRGPQEASQALGISLPRYYHLEARAIEGLIAGLEPRPRRGRRRTPESEVAALSRDKQRLEREVQRLQALVRVAQRTIGLAPVASKPAGGKRRRARRAMVRASKAAAVLRTTTEAPASAALVSSTSGVGS